MSHAFASWFSLCPTPYIVLEEGVTFRQGEEKTQPTNIGTEANKSQGREEGGPRESAAGLYTSGRKSSKE